LFGQTKTVLKSGVSNQQQKKEYDNKGLLLDPLITILVTAAGLKFICAYLCTYTYICTENTQPHHAPEYTSCVPKGKILKAKFENTSIETKVLGALQ